MLLDISDHSVMLAHKDGQAALVTLVVSVIQVVLDGRDQKVI